MNQKKKDKVFCGLFGHKIYIGKNKNFIWYCMYCGESMNVINLDTGEAYIE